MRSDHVLRRGIDSHQVEVVNEPEYTFGASDNHAHYQREELLGDAGFEPISRHAVISIVAGERVASVIFGAAGGASGVHERSLAIFRELGFLAIGPFIVCFGLPLLTTRWVREVDSATCFGIHICPDERSLVSHGELEISRLTLTGDVLWRTGGRDIFTGDLSVEATRVLAEDFNGDAYSFDLETGDVGAGRRPTSR